MTSKLVPANPDEVMVIRDITPNITTLSLPFLRFGHIKIGGRATIVKLSSGSLAVFSPVALTPGVQAKLTSLGNRVAYIAAPDIEHHLYVSAWAAAYPNAHVIGVEGLAEKRATASATNPDITNVPINTIFTKANKAEQKVTEEFDRDFEVEFVDAHPNKELVFYYKPDRTVIEADLLFNLPATEQYSKSGVSATTGLLTRFFGAVQNTRGAATWQKRAQWYVFSKADREGYGKSVKRIASWKIDNIVPCHGDVMLGDGQAIFQKVFAWHLEGKNKA